MVLLRVGRSPFGAFTDDGGRMGMGYGMWDGMAVMERALMVVSGYGVFGAGRWEDIEGPVI